MEQMPYFHVSASPLAAGTVLRPFTFFNNFRDEMRTMATALEVGPEAVRTIFLADYWLAARLRSALSVGHKAASVLIETVFEHVRSQDYGDRPSRLVSAFAYPSLQTAERFRQQYRQQGVVLRCRLIDGEAFVGDMALSTPGLSVGRPMEPQVDALRERAHAYWQGVASPEWPEVLLKGRVEIVTSVE
jgi:hypothetical protein